MRSTLKIMKAVVHNILRGDTKHYTRQFICTLINGELNSFYIIIQDVKEIHRKIKQESNEINKKKHLLRWSVKSSNIVFDLFNKISI